MRAIRLLPFTLLPLILRAQLAVPASPGSIFAPAGRFADATRDFRAGQLDDLITIVVSENASAVSSGVTNTSRKSSAKNSITSLGGALATTNPLANLAALGGNQQLQGTGQTSRNLTLSTTISARVIDVRPNGAMVIEGTRQIAINSEKQNVTVRGIIRPNDVTTANTILSTQVANLEVDVNGKGVVGDAIKRPFILYRLLLGFLPF